MPLLEVIQTVTTDEESLKTGFEYGEKLNNLTKFVASSKLDDAPWGDFPAATVTRDPAATIRRLKEQSGKDIWLWGS